MTLQPPLAVPQAYVHAFPGALEGTTDARQEAEPLACGDQLQRWIAGLPDMLAIALLGVGCQERADRRGALEVIGDQPLLELDRQGLVGVVGSDRRLESLAEIPQVGFPGRALRRLEGFPGLCEGGLELVVRGLGRRPR